MKSGVPIEIAGRVIFVPRLIVALVVVGILTAGAAYAVQVAQTDLQEYADEQQRASDAAAYRLTVNGVDSLRAGCVRSNVLRQAAWNNAMIDAISREAAASELGSGDQLRALAAQNRADAVALVRAAADFPRSPASPQVDCVGAYPAPETPPGVARIEQEPLRAVKIKPFRPTRP